MPKVCNWNSITMAKWIDTAKGDVVKSDDWEVVSDLLHQAVLQQLKEFHVSLFSELNNVERDLCINRALKLIENHQSYQALFKTVSVTLQQAVLEQVKLATQDRGHNLDQSSSYKNDSNTQMSSETDRILQCTADAAAKLLEKRPQFHKRLYLCFNRRLPEPLRHIAWKLQLRNESVYRDCFNEIEKLKKNRQLGRHINIKHRCKAIIHTEPLFAALAQEMNLPDIMEIILSYRQLHLKDNASLVDTDYMLLLPFLYLKCGNWNNCTIQLIATTIEYYTVFMSTRREHMKETGNQVPYVHIDDQSYPSLFVIHIKFLNTNYCFNLSFL